jgi:hypothetical protein
MSPFFGGDSRTRARGPSISKDEQVHGIIHSDIGYIRGSKAKEVRMGICHYLWPDHMWRCQRLRDGTSFVSNIGN